MLLCSKCGKPARVGKKLLADGKRVRVCKSCGEVID
jgi:large subunit ribosomal protein L24